MPEQKKNWVDFRHVRETVDFGTVLEAYGVTLKLRRDEQHHGFCPLPSHEGQGRSPSFSAHLGKKAFHCFGCQAKGNAIDFVALMEGLNPDHPRDIRQAALLIQERFLHEQAEPLPRASQSRRPQRERKPQHRRQQEAVEKSESEETLPIASKVKQSDNRVRIINAPLDFELKQLDPDHPYLQERGLTTETIQEFGLGFCSRGLMANRIAIPLHDAEGKLIGYAGRVVDDSTIDEENPKYLMPGPREREGKVFEFSKSAFLFNGHHIQAPVSDLIVVEGFFSVFHLYQCGWTNVVAVMGSSCSPEQAALIVKLTTEDGQVWLMPDGDKGGRECAESLQNQISPHRSVHTVVLDGGKDPCNHTRDELARFLDSEHPATRTTADDDSDLKHIQMVSLRLVREKALPYASQALLGSEAVYDLFRELTEDLDRESLWVMCLDTKGFATCLSQVSLGTINSAPARPVDVLKVAVLSNAMSVILVHNHPSGDPQPSPDDRTATNNIKEAGKLLGIRLLDHLIVGNGAYYSFKDQGGL